MGKKTPFRPKVEPEEFRPTTALGRSLPAAVFWSLVVMSYAGPAFEKAFSFSWVHPFVTPGVLMTGITITGMITPLWSGLAIAYSIRCRSHDGVRWTFLAFNAASILGWIALLGGALLRVFSGV